MDFNRRIHFSFLHVMRGITTGKGLFSFQLAVCTDRSPIKGNNVLNTTFSKCGFIQQDTKALTGEKCQCYHQNT